MKNSLFLLLILCSKLSVAVEPGKWTANDINTLLHRAQSLSDEGAKIDYISSRFLNTPYQAHTLIGNAKKPEQFTVRLDGVDCMTYIDSVEALRRSHSFEQFLGALKSVRYKNGIVAFQNRNHFFLNWRDNNTPFIVDVTRQVGDTASHSIVKHLNAPRQKPLIPGIPVVGALMHYIPGYRIDHTILSRLKSGDYVGLYTDRLGLDVTHVGIVVKKGTQTFFRHASNEPYVNKVVDSAFVDYFKYQRGFIVLRPLSSSINRPMPTRALKTATGYSP
jgi:hypothetical protein